MDPASGRRGESFGAGWLALGMGLLMLLAHPPAIFADFAGDPPTAVPRELVVAFDESSSLSERRRAVSKAGARIDESLESFDGAVLVIRPNRQAEDVLERLSDSDAVE